jgi:hypothetical protein
MRVSEYLNNIKNLQCETAKVLPEEEELKKYMTC